MDWETPQHCFFLSPFCIVSDIKKYNFNLYPSSKLHYKLKDLAPYIQRNKKKAAKPHRHHFYQIIWFKEKVVITLMMK